MSQDATSIPLQRLHEAQQKIHAQLSQVIVGQRDVLDPLLDLTKGRIPTKTLRMSARVGVLLR